MSHINALRLPCLPAERCTARSKVMQLLVNSEERVVFHALCKGVRRALYGWGSSFLRRACGRPRHTMCPLAALSRGWLVTLHRLLRVPPFCGFVALAVFVSYIHTYKGCAVHL